MKLNDLLFNRLIEERKEVKPMETKSRYEVIAELEAQKRTLIRERDGFDDKVFEKDKEIKASERELDDTIRKGKREIDDLKEDLTNFKKTMTERKETIKELIRSIDESLGRFNKLQDKGNIK